MTTLTGSFTERFQESLGRRFNWQYFLQDNITGHWTLAVWVIVLGLATLTVTVRQLSAFPTGTTIILLLWVAALLIAAAEGLHFRHSRLGRWLKANLLGSVSNALLTLFLSLIVITVLYGIWQWAIVNATFDPTLSEQSTDGANWGVIASAWDLLMVGRFPRDQLGRVGATVVFFVVMSVVTFAAHRTGLWTRSKLLKRILTALWTFSPVLVYILLAGVPAEGTFINPITLIVGEIAILGIFALFWWQKVIKFTWLTFLSWALFWPVAYLLWRALGKSGLFPPIIVATWGGLLLTLIIAASVIILSFPLGMVLALGRRSEVRGIPWWLIWPVAIIIAIWGLTTSTPSILAASEATWQRILAFWPILLLVAAYILQRTFHGNVIAAACTTFIEIIRGVPLITLLFMGIIMARFFLAEGAEVQNVYAVIVAYSLFSAAYMAELIRGGLQAIPRGQYDAADAIGLNTLQKMRFIILPQAIAIVIPGIVGQFIGSYKSSSLVVLVGLFELLGTINNITNNPQWLGTRTELYVFAAVIYFTGSFIMSWYSRRLEGRLAVGQR